MLQICDHERFCHNAGVFHSSNDKNREHTGRGKTAMGLAWNEGGVRLSSVLFGVSGKPVEVAKQCGGRSESKMAAERRAGS